MKALVRLLAAPWTVACWAPLSMVFPRQDSWSSHSLFPGTFPTQGLNLRLPHCRWILYHLSPLGSPYKEDTETLRRKFLLRTLNLRSVYTIPSEAILSQQSSQHGSHELARGRNAMPAADGTGRVVSTSGSEMNPALPVVSHKLRYIPMGK